jgi:crotonobetainyl-CoA:carnitine CoA-transferase CaiB-like acyl-CoA transferase
VASLPLAGVRVLSLAEQYPGPYATMLLADLGAEVIMVERPGGGDPARRFPGLFAAFCRNKRSVALDLKSAQGLNDFLGLVDTADVVIEGFRPGVMERLGIGADALRARKPALVFVSITAFGQSGPNVGVVGHDLSIQAAAGMIDVPVGHEAALALPVLPLADISSAMFAALGVVTALYARNGSGQGANVDVSMFDGLVSWMTPFLVPPANGLPTRILPPLDPGYGLFATADGRQITLSIAGEDAMWSTLCKMLGLDRFAALHEVERSERAAEISPFLRAAVAGWTYDALYQQLASRGIAFGPVRRLDQVLTDPQSLERRMAVQVDGVHGRQTFIRQPLIIDGQIGEIRCQAPELGQDNAVLLSRENAPSIA